MANLFYPQQSLINPSTSPEAVITTAPSGQTGTWTQVIDPLPFSSNGLLFYFDSEGANAEFYIEIGVSEDGGTTINKVYDTIVEHSGNSATYIGHYIFVPIQFKKGWGIYVRGSNSSTVSVDMFVKLLPFTKDFYSLSGLSRAKTYGPISVTADAYSSIVEVTPNVPFAVRWVAIGISGLYDTTWSDIFFWVRLYVGPANAEKVIHQFLDIAIESLLDAPNPPIWSFPVQIPKGERLAISHNVQGTIAMRLDYYVTIMG